MSRAGNRPCVSPAAAAVGAPFDLDALGAVTVRCVFAMAFAGAAMGLLVHVGIIKRQVGSCGSLAGDYETCEAMEDLRLLVSFALSGIASALCSAAASRRGAQRTADADAEFDTEGAGRSSELGDLRVCLF